MKTKCLLLSLSMTLITLISYAGNSVNTEDHPDGIIQIEDRVADRLTVKADKQLLKAEKRQYRAEKNMVWISKVINKKMAKSQNKAAGSGEKTMSLLSMLFGIGGFLFLFIPYVGILGLLMAIAGFVLGFVSMKKEGSNTMNILGIVFGGLTLLLFLVAVVIVASWGF